MSTELIEASVIEQSMIALALEAVPAINPLTLETPPLVLNSPPETNKSSYQQRDPKTSILHADEELYQKQLEAKGGKEAKKICGRVVICMSYGEPSRS